MQVGSKQDGGKHEEPPRSIHETNGDLCAAAYLRRAGLALARGHVRYLHWLAWTARASGHRPVSSAPANRRAVRRSVGLTVDI